MVFFASLSCMKTNLGFTQTQKISIPSIKLASQTRTSILNPPKIAKTLRENASFPSYNLHGSNQTSVLKPSTFSTPYNHFFLRKNKNEDTEIDIFDAEKYFNEGLVKSDPTPKLDATNMKLSTHNGQIKKKDDHTPKIFERNIATPSICSESSSNSRKLLLNNNISRKSTRANNKKKNTFLGCIKYCSCNNKNSLEVDDYNSIDGKSKHDDKIIRPEIREINSNSHFSFPVANSRPGKMQTRDKEQKSLENTKNSNMFTWDDIKKIPSVSSEMYNDSESDTSSDLFEISSFSTGNHFLSSEGSTCNNYAPSEASIEWSVTTSSGVRSDSSEDRQKNTGLNNKSRSFEEIPKRRSSILSGCKSEKAVRVAGDSIRANHEKGFSNAIRRQSMTTRFNGDESKNMAGFGARKNMQQQSFDQRARNAAHLFYI